MSERFREWLQQQMDEAGLNQNELAQKSGLYPSNISMVLSGEKEPGINFFTKIAKGLRLPPGQVFEQYILATPKKSTRGQLLATKVSEVAKLLAENGREGEIQLIYEFAEMLSGRLEVPLPAQSITEVIEVSLPTELTNPNMEDVIDILRFLDQLEVQNIYDYARWRFIEQKRRRDSSRRIERNEETKKREWQEAIDLIDLMLAIEEATPQEREGFIVYLMERYKSQETGYLSGKPVGETLILANQRQNEG